MIEIKFRGKHIHAMSCNEHLDGGWIYGYLSAEDYICKGDYERLVDKDTVGQFTGLKDYKKKDAYIGDIVIEPYKSNGSYGIIRQEKDNMNAYIEWNFQRKYDGEMFWSTNEIPLRNVGSYAIIGNVWDNPELLKGVE